jgi:hypothetical protein
MIIATKQIKLKKFVDWITWLSFVKIRAQKNNIWELVDSNKNIRSFYLIKSIESMIMKSINAKKFLRDYEIYKIRIIVYKTALTRYNDQKETFKNLIQFIQFIVFTSAAIFIQNVNAHSWDQLRALKQRLTSFDQIREIEIETKHNDLCKRSINQNVEKWLNAWQLNYVEIKKLKIFEFSKNRSMSRDVIIHNTEDCESRVLMIKRSQR